MRRLGRLARVGRLGRVFQNLAGFLSGAASLPASAAPFLFSAFTALFLLPVFTALFLLPAHSLAAAEILKSEVRFTASHPLKTVRGVCQDIFIDQIRITRGSEYRVRTPLTLVCDAAKMDTGNGRRDEHLREALGYPKYKKITVHVQSVTLSKSDLADYIASGVITIAGKDRSFSSVVHTKEAGERIEIAGGFSVKLSEFEIEPPSLLFMEVKDDIQIEYSFTFRVKRELANKPAAEAAPAKKAEAEAVPANKPAVEATPVKKPAAN